MDIKVRWLMAKKEKIFAGTHKKFGKFSSIIDAKII